METDATLSTNTSAKHVNEWLTIDHGPDGSAIIGLDEDGYAVGPIRGALSFMRGWDCDGILAHCRQYGWSCEHRSTLTDPQSPLAWSQGK